MPVYRLEDAEELRMFRDVGNTVEVAQMEFPMYVIRVAVGAPVYVQTSKSAYGKYAKPAYPDTITIPYPKTAELFNLGRQIADMQRIIKIHQSGRGFYKKDTLNPEWVFIDEIPSVPSDMFEPQADFKTSEEIHEYLANGGTIKSPHGNLVELIDGRQQIYGGTRCAKQRPYALKNPWAWRKHEPVSEEVRMLLAIQRIRDGKAL